MRGFLGCALLALSVAAAACGPGVTTATASGGGADYEIRASRHGKSLYLDVIGTRVSARKQAPFDNAAAWRVDAHADNRPLQRAVNGSVRVARDPVGRRDWRVTVKFSVAFTMLTPASRVRVRLKPPGHRAQTLSLALR